MSEDQFSTSEFKSSAPACNTHSTPLRPQAELSIALFVCEGVWVLSEGVWVLSGAFCMLSEADNVKTSEKS